MIINIGKKKPQYVKTNGCTYCGTVYNRKDFYMCPSCGGDSSATTPKVWRGNKSQRKEFAKKQSEA